MRRIFRRVAWVALVALASPAFGQSVTKPEPPWARRRVGHPAEPPTLVLDLGTWFHATSGEVTGEDDTTTDLEDDLALESGLDVVLGVGFEHPVRWLPDLRLEFLPLGIAGGRRLDAPFTFEGVRFAAGERVRTGMEARQIDLIAYWRPLRLGPPRTPWVAVRVGATVRNVAGQIFVRSETTTRESETPLDVPLLPMADVLVEGLPYSIVGAVAGARVVVLGENRWLDFGGAVQVRPAGPNLSLSVGWRQQQIVLVDAADAEADISIGGLTVGAALQF